MPISSVTNRVSYQCDGTSAVFAFPYRFHAHADLQGFIYNSSLSEPNIIRALELNASGGFGFTVSATADQSNVYPNGGSVVLNSAPNAQCVIVVFRSSAITNGFSISKNGPIPSSGLNNAIDYLTMLIQRGQDLLTRSVRLPDGYPRTFDPTLPNTIVASSVLMFNSGATGFAIGPTAYEIANAQSSALSAANSEASANASATAAGSAAVSVGNNLLLVNSAVTSVNNAVSLIGSTAYWGAEAASSALSAFNSQVLANSGALSASNSATLANSAAISAGAQAVLAGSAALSASNQATLAGSAALSASNSAANVATIVAPTSVSANYNALTSDRTILANSSNYTINLYGAAGNAGREVTVIKTGSSVLGITIAGSAATIAGMNSVALDFKDEFYSLVCTGSEWNIKGWNYPSRIINSNVILVASSGAAYNGTGTQTNRFEFTKTVEGRWGFRFQMDVNHVSTATPRINLGSGVVSFLPQVFVPLYGGSISTGTALYYGRTDTTGCVIQVAMAAASTRTLIGGDVHLDAKPTTAF